MVVAAAWVPALTQAGPHSLIHMQVRVQPEQYTLHRYGRLIPGHPGQVTESEAAPRTVFPDHQVPDHPFPDHPVPDHPFPDHQVPDHPFPDHRVPVQVPLREDHQVGDRK
jgi:hypothetical protein